MKEHQVKGRANQARGEVRKVAGRLNGDEGTQCQDKAEPHSGKGRAVLADINDDAKKAAK